MWPDRYRHLVLGANIKIGIVEVDENGEESLTITGHDNDIPQYYEANWPVDLSGTTGDLTLSFENYHSYTYNATPFSGSFTDRADASGIAVSSDGVTWHPIWNMRAQEMKEWTSHSIDLSAALNAAGLEDESEILVRFQYYARPEGEVGAPDVYFDSLMIANEEPTEDWYRFSLEDGQVASLMADGDGSMEMAFYDSQSNLLAEGLRAINADQTINLFGDTTTNGQPDTYFVRITGSEGPYSLVVTRDAALDLEPNRDFAMAQDVTGADSVLGNLGDQPNWASEMPDQQGNITQVAEFAGPQYARRSPGRAAAAVGSEVVIGVAVKDESDNHAIGGTDLYVYDKVTGRELASHDLEAILDLDMTRSAEYPSVSYDAATGRFMVAVVAIAEQDVSATLRIGVSENSSPTKASDWRVYNYDLTRELEGTGLSYLSSFEMVLSDNAVWLSGN